MEGTNMNNRRRNRRIDRLSSLPDDILIGIISLLPLQLAITTGTLSRRWRGLCSNITCIDITVHDTDTYKLLILNPLNNTIRQITSPFIHSFSIDFVGSFNLDFWAPCMDIIIRDVCNRDVHQLKVTWCNPETIHQLKVTWSNPETMHMYTLPSVIFQMQSLVSMELGSKDRAYYYYHYYCDWQFPYDCNAINLPNLKSLTIYFALEFEILKWIEKLIKFCPSLEKLSLNCCDRKIDTSLESCKIVINSPNLEYLAISAPKSLTFSFEEEPIVLREAKIEFTDLFEGQADEEKLSKFYEAISKVRILTLDISTVDTLSTTVFRNVTRLTFNMKLRLCLNTLLSVLEMCPVLDVLNLKFCGVDYNYKKQPLYQKPGDISTSSQQAIRKIKSINVEIDNRRTYYRYAEPFSRLIMDLLRSTCDLEHLNLRVNYFHQDWLPPGNLLLDEKDEIKLCKKLYWCPTISNCDVEFKGSFIKMSRKDGPKLSTQNGKVICFGRPRSF